MSNDGSLIDGDRASHEAYSFTNDGYDVPSRKTLHDGMPGVATSGVITVGTTAVEITTGNLARRYVLDVYNGGSAAVFLGGDNVTTANGRQLPASQGWAADVGPVRIYAIAATTNTALSILEIGRTSEGV